MRQRTSTPTPPPSPSALTEDVRDMPPPDPEEIYRIEVAFCDLRLQSLKPHLPDPTLFLTHGIGPAPEIQAKLDRIAKDRDRAKTDYLKALLEKAAPALQKLGEDPPAGHTAEAEEIPTMSEAEAAPKLGYSAKQLGNLRRAKQIPRSLYRQPGKGCLVRYYRERFETWAANKQAIGKE